MSNDLKPLALTVTKIMYLFALRKLLSWHICFTQTNREIPMNSTYNS
uniref:Uncharacterized protein n=1 Tax=Siphoviridae sp. ctyjS2 TaxID=2827284 RepID=A0A8S5R3E2_9CAUD|nr:MAG TPA: hypothetical protein [Siphoviridae sp. ctyjS2]